MVLRTRSDTTKEIEILRPAPPTGSAANDEPPRMSWTDRALRQLPLSRLLPVRPRLGMLVTRPRFCAGTDRSSHDAGPPSPSGPVDPRSPPASAPWSSLWPNSTLAELNVGISTDPWRPRRPRLPDRRLHRLRKSCTAPVSTHHHAAPDPRGMNSSERKHTRSSPANCSTSTPSPSIGSTSSSASSTWCAAAAARSRTGPGDLRSFAWPGGRSPQARASAWAGAGPDPSAAVRPAPRQVGQPVSEPGDVEPRPASSARP